MIAPTAPPEAPCPAWRIGIVGPTDGALLHRLTTTAARHLLATQHAAPLLRLVTTLDDGAGAIVAEVAQSLAADPGLARLDLRIEAILPFPGAEASPALAPGWAAIQAWAATRPAGAVQALSLDGRDQAGRREERAVDRMVMRNADTLLILHAGDIQDTTRAAEMLRFAARQGPSVLWHDAGTDWLLRDATDMHNAAEARRHPGQTPAGGNAPRDKDAWAVLEAEVVAALRPPRAAAAHPHGILERLVHAGCAHHRRDPYETFLAERGHRGGGLWAAYGMVRNRAARATGGWPAWLMPSAVAVLILALALPFLVAAEGLGQARVALLLAVLPIGLLALGARALGHSGPHPHTDPPPPTTLAFWCPALQALAVVTWLGLLAALLVSPDSAIGEPVPVFALVATPVLLLALRGVKRAGAEPPQAAREDDRAAMYWWRAYEPADRLAIAYANRYRSAYVVIILMVALALVFAVLGLAFSGNKILVKLVLAAEALMLAGIIGFVAASIAGSWQERWVGYRLLAELCRKQEALSRLGWSLPIYDVRDASEAGLAGGAWIAWHFNALTRAAPLPGHVVLTVAAKQAIRDRILGQAGQREEQASGLIQGQLDYHRGRKTKSAAAAQCWAMWGEFAFIGTVGCVGVKILMKLAGWHWEHEVWLGILAAALPAVSAAFFALRAYSEEKLMAEQSRRMEADLAAAKRAVAAIPLAEPLSSQELAAETFEIAQRMLADITGWAQLVRVKVVEAG